MTLTFDIGTWVLYIYLSSMMLTYQSEHFYIVRGLSQKYPENDYNFFNINGIHLKFYMLIEQIIGIKFDKFYDHGWYI